MAGWGAVVGNSSCAIGRIAVSVLPPFCLVRHSMLPLEMRAAAAAVPNRGCTHGQSLGGCDCKTDLAETVACITGTSIGRHGGRQQPHRVSFSHIYYLTSSHVFLLRLAFGCLLPTMYVVVGYASVRARSCPVTVSCGGRRWNIEELWDCGSRGWVQLSFVVSGLPRGAVGWRRRDAG